MTQVIMLVETSYKGDNPQLQEVIHIGHYDNLNADEFKPSHVTDGFLNAIGSSREKSSTTIVEGIEELGRQFMDTDFGMVKVNITDNEGFTLGITVVTVNPYV